MELLVLSFVAGILTVLAPCVLPLLPVIIGGSVQDGNKLRPIIITLSLAGSIVLFTLLLKASSVLIDIPQSFWTYFSAGIILIFAFSLLFPIYWAKMLHKLGLARFEQSANKSLYQNSKKTDLIGMIATGAALGPVFASCSPTYFYVLGTVLPASWLAGILNLIAYSLGLAGIMFVVAYASQKMLHRLNGLSNPHGWFKRTLGIIFLIVGLAIITGYDKKIEVAILDAGWFNPATLDQNLLDAQLDKEDKEIEEKNMPEQELQPNNQDDQVQSALPKLFRAPNILGTGEWVNTEPIDSLESLRGKVVLLDFWTYSCINCVRTLEHTQGLYEKYGPQNGEESDFEIIGVHTPEFSFEHKIENVRREVASYGLTHPVVQDNDYKTWRAYRNRYWPAFYLIDREGIVRYTHFGEGAYDEKDQVIGQLLAEGTTS